jgi:predicted nucleic acid-binding protein
VPRYLVDKSALARLHLRPVHQRLGPLIESGDVASCSIVDLELLYSARNLTEYEALLDERRGLPQITMTQSTFDDAITIQHELARNGHHRLPIPDLIIAAAARSADLAVIHYHNDFQLIADATDLKHEWVAPAGSLYAASLHGLVEPP